MLLAASLFAATVSGEPADDGRMAIDKSQQALGNRVGNASFVDSHGNKRELDEFLGKPVAISMIYTSCAQSCSVITPHIKRVMQVGRDSLGTDSFTVLSIGFDLPVDTPENMASYARRFGIREPNWHFLTPVDSAALESIAEDTGFHYVPSPNGFDHTVQVTLLDEEGKVFRQVYGEIFDTPLLIEPLKHLVFDTPAPDEGVFSRLANRVRLFCTVYDPKSDRYYFDYSLFMGILAGVLVIGFGIIWLLREIGHRRRGNANEG